ncbi:hypothetical protein GCM10017788_14160 [Amycolatopsis acidiphila]|nr:hypothetical protein GCM10017788_14160 [Amycolatopsis acidiphila]
MKTNGRYTVPAPASPWPIDSLRSDDLHSPPSPDCATGGAPCWTVVVADVDAGLSVVLDAAVDVVVLGWGPAVFAAPHAATVHASAATPAASPT